MRKAPGRWLTAYSSSVRASSSTGWTRLALACQAASVLGSIQCTSGKRRGGGGGGTPDAAGGEAADHLERDGGPGQQHHHGADQYRQKNDQEDDQPPRPAPLPVKA